MGLAEDGRDDDQGTAEGRKTGPNPNRPWESGGQAMGYGVPIGVAVDSTYRHDINLVRATIASIVVTIAPTADGGAAAGDVPGQRL